MRGSSTQTSPGCQGDLTAGRGRQHHALRRPCSEHRLGLFSCGGGSAAMWETLVQREITAFCLQ